MRKNAPLPVSVLLLLMNLGLLSFLPDAAAITLATVHGEPISGQHPHCCGCAEVCSGLHVPFQASRRFASAHVLW
jgi:hypothetical protein